MTTSPEELTRLTDAAAAAAPIWRTSSADDRARWIREQIKSIELDLETTSRGWEKKLVELLGQ